MLIAAPADSRFEASCRYARSAEYRDEQAEEEELLRRTEAELDGRTWYAAAAAVARKTHAVWSGARRSTPDPTQLRRPHDQPA